MPDDPVRVYHPNADAVRDTVDDVDDMVTLGRETFAVADDGTLEVPATHARTLARSYGLALSEIVVDGEGEGESEDADDAPEQDADEGGDEEGEVCGAELSDGGTCDRLAAECPYHGDDGDE